ncbi:uncharacterized protein DEA37_0000274 [Paragonimus westermani]|uniref:Uncharacterized protein n=1 Tax=Paragonimus westermani TaxID=34504 RepID=A0A5J4NV53_9TREM|nr:uncharacterized protein DEA37_0000274 [Paragonimus westermani]
MIIHSTGLITQILGLLEQIVLAAYVTAIIPCLFLTIILIRGVTLPGAWMGIKFFLVPAWSKLASFQIWSQAALQIFFSLGPSWGGIIAVASYNKYDHPIMR